jgi:DNA primase
MENSMTRGEAQQDISEKIKEQADIVQIIGESVDLKKSGARYLGLCPFHGEKTPSFSVHQGRQFFHCFGCGESGDVFSFMMKYHNLDFPEALKELARRCNIQLPEKRRSKEDEIRRQKRDQLYAVNQKAAEIYSSYLQKAPGAEEARAYLHKRGVDGGIIERFCIGYAPAVETEGWNYLGGKLSAMELGFAIETGLLVKKEQAGSYDRFRDRIVFPIAEISGRICGFGGRIVGQGKPKYLNSPESDIYNKSKLLLGLYQQKEEIRRQNQAVVVEGNFDLISLVAHGLSHVVAPLGTALTREQLRLLKRFATEVTLLFDGDAAGLKAAVRSAPLFLAEQIPAKVAVLPDGEDPDTYIRSHGLPSMNTLLAAAESLPEFLFGCWTQEYGLGLDGKSRIVEELRPMAAASASPLQHSVLIAHFAEKLNMPAEELRRHLKTPEISAEKVSVLPQKNERVDRVKPLSMPQKQLLAFVVLQPRFLSQLESAGVREFLAGSVGEIVFLQYKRLLQMNPEAEPEELLTALPDGEERNLVANILISAQGRVEDDNGELAARELADLLDYLRRQGLKKSSEELMRRMQVAQNEGNLSLLEELMAEKLILERKMHGEQA